MMNPLKITKTRYSKIAVSHFLTEKETISALEEYQAMFNQLAIVLYEIDSCSTKSELRDKFNNGILNPIGTQEHKDKEEEDIILFSTYLLRTEKDSGFNINETKYTLEDVLYNLEKFNFL